MTGRVDKAKAAFIEIYTKDLWGLKKLRPQVDLLQYFATMVEETIRRYGVSSVVEFGCGFWSYAELVDWGGVTYDGYDVNPGAIELNTNAHSAPNIRFHEMVEGMKPVKADLLICRDVLQHLPVDDVIHYLAMFKDLFTYMLIVNDIEPVDNLNGPIAYGGYRALRLDLPPFNESFEIVKEWDSPAFGVPYRKQACLLRGTRPIASPATADAP